VRNPQTAHAVDFDLTFDELYPPLLRYCHRLTGDRDAAEDTAQEAMVRLYTHGVEGPTPALRVWLFKTATRLVRDRYRVEENRRRLLEANPVTPGETEGTERALERGRERRRVRKVLEQLGDRDREMLLMRYEGFSYREIAEMVDVAATSVGTLLARAERRFLDVLEGGREST
jgi:RNA polymerase sigma factor (sigma-70 family)